MLLLIPPLLTLLDVFDYVAFPKVVNWTIIVDTAFFLWIPPFLRLTDWSLQPLVVLMEYVLVWFVKLVVDLKRRSRVVFRQIELAKKRCKCVMKVAVICTKSGQNVFVICLNLFKPRCVLQTFCLNNSSRAGYACLRPTAVLQACRLIFQSPPVTW